MQHKKSNLFFVCLLSKLFCTVEHYRDFSIEIECCVLILQFFVGATPNQFVLVAIINTVAPMDVWFTAFIPVLLFFTMVFCLETKYLFNNRTFYFYFVNLLLATRGVIPGSHFKNSISLCCFKR